MDILLSTLLTSTVVAAIVSGLVSFFQSERAHSVKLITSERSTWRSELKEAIVSLRKEFNISPTSGNVGESLACIESRINPYGKYDSSNDIAELEITSDKTKLSTPQRMYFLRDGHIWAALEAYRKERTLTTLDNLIDYLGLLLKYDWERSKSEAKLNKYWIVAIIIFCIGCLSFSQLSTGNSLGECIMIFSGPVVFPVYLSNISTYSKSKFKDILYSSPAFLYWIVCFGALYFSILNVDANFNNTYSIVAVFSFFISFIVSCYATVGSRWGRDNNYIYALIRKATSTEKTTAINIDGETSQNK